VPCFVYIVQQKEETIHGHVQGHNQNVGTRIQLYDPIF
jgi:hypothetical protein